MVIKMFNNKNLILYSYYNFDLMNEFKRKVEIFINIFFLLLIKLINI